MKKITTTGDVIGLNLFADGKKLIWARKSANTKYILCTLYAYDLDKRNVMRLPFPERVAGLNAPSKIPPSKVNYVIVSPAGDRLAMIVEHIVGKRSPGGQEMKYWACWTVKLDRSEAKQIYRTPAAEKGGEGPFPVWSKDGSQIAVLEVEEKKLKIAVFRPDGSSGRRILDQKAE
jgi:Tol biopolymer transport system component